MLLDGRFSAAIRALFHVVHSVIGRFPSAALMRAWAGGGDGFGLRFIVADGAYLMPGTGFSGSCFFINDPFSEGVGGIINAGCVTVCTDFPMVGFIRCPVGKGGMVTGVKPTVWFAADFALFLCVAGGSAACVGGFLYNRTAICTLFHMMHSISGRFPRSAALMCAGDGMDGGRFFVVANAALSAFGSRFGGGRFLCDLPLAVGVGGFFYICAAS